MGKRRRRAMQKVRGAVRAVYPGAQLGAVQNERHSVVYPIHGGVGRRRQDHAPSLPGKLVPQADEIKGPAPRQVKAVFLFLSALVCPMQLGRPHSM